MQAQTAITLPRRSYSTMVAVVATVVAALLALALVVSVGRPAAYSLPQQVTLQDVSGQQVAHNRSEQGLGGASVGGQQIVHNRSEEGFTNP